MIGTKYQIKINSEMLNINLQGTNIHFKISRKQKCKLVPLKFNKRKSVLQNSCHE